MVYLQARAYSNPEDCRIIATLHYNRVVCTDSPLVQLFSTCNGNSFQTYTVLLFAQTRPHSRSSLCNDIIASACQQYVLMYRDAYPHEMRPRRSIVVLHRLVPPAVLRVQPFLVYCDDYPHEMSRGPIVLLLSAHTRPYSSPIL